MRLATISYQGATRAAIVGDGQYSVLSFADIREVLASGLPLADLGGHVESEIAAEGVKLLAPVTEPEKTICIGLNFRDHAAEAGMAVPDYPTVFAKYSRSLIGPTDDIEMPYVSDAVDWEAEIGLIIGRPCRDASEQEARDAIAGYTVVNDISMRDYQLRTSQFLQGKTFERSTPFGPHLVTPDEIDHARDLRMTCHVNGQKMQDSSTANMIFSPVQIVAYLSRIITLMPGDLIACGTPSGIGGLMKPPLYLKPGDVVTTAVEGVGTITNRCGDIVPPRHPT